MSRGSVRRPARRGRLRGRVRAVAGAQWAVLVALATLCAWFALFSRLQPETFFDESSHLAAMQAIAAGKYALHPELPMFPGYHWLVYVLSRPVGLSLTAARLTSLGCAVLGLLLYCAVRRRRYGPEPLAALRFAWLPLLLPFTAMAYTDVPSIALLLGAVWAVTRGRWLESALWVALAVAVRQDNVVWLCFFAGWAVLESRSDTRLPARRVAGYAVVGLGFALLFLRLGRVQAYPVEGQEVALNVNHLYVLALLVLVLWLPVWPARIAAEWRRMTAAARRAPGRAAVGLVLPAALAAWLVASYRIVHHGNAYTGFFLRNEPLLWMRDELTLRVLGVALVGVATLLVARFIQEQPDRRMLLLVTATGVLYVALHGLVEPRYYLVPIVLFGLFTSLPRDVEARLVAWQGLLCVALAAVIARDWLW